jgi:hypothetical protein
MVASIEILALSYAGRPLEVVLVVSPETAAVVVSDDDAAAVVVSTILVTLVELSVVSLVLFEAATRPKKAASSVRCIIFLVGFVSLLLLLLTRQ